MRSKVLFLTLVIFECILLGQAHGQDIVIKKDGRQLRTRIIDQDSERIKYHKYEQEDGPVFILYFDEIRTIRYDGKGYQGLPDEVSPQKSPKNNAQPEPDEKTASDTASKSIAPPSRGQNDQHHASQPATSVERENPMLAQINGRLALGAALPLGNFGQTLPGLQNTTLQVGNATTGVGISIGLEYRFAGTHLGIGAEFNAVTNEYQEDGLRSLIKPALEQEFDSTTTITINSISTEPNSNNLVGLYLFSREHLGKNWVYQIRVGAAYQTFIAGEILADFNASPSSGQTQAFRAPFQQLEGEGIAILGGFCIEYMIDGLIGSRNANAPKASLGLEVQFSQAYLNMDPGLAPRQDLNLLQPRAVLNVPLQ